MKVAAGDGVMDPASNKPGVLIIVENLPVPLDRRVWQEACALRDGGYEVSVICPQMRGYLEPRETLDGIHIYRHPISSEASGVAGFLLEYATALWGEMRCAIKAWRERRFSVIHLCNPPDLLFLVALPFKWFRGVRVLFDVHDLWPEMFLAKFGRRLPPVYWAVRLAERCTLAVADVVIATNESVLEAVVRRGKKKSKDVFVVRTSPKEINTGIEANPERTGNSSFLVGYIGVMGDADGVDYLLYAARHIADKKGPLYAKFCLMGTGPEWNKLKALRDKLSLQDIVEMPGRVTEEFLCETLQSMDLGVACDPINDYNDHCTMNKTLEYMAFGKAQVMFGIKEGKVSAGGAAYYVDENSAEELAEAIVGLLEDEDRRQKMGTIGRARLNGDLSWEASSRQLRAAYSRLLSGTVDRSDLTGRESI